MLGQEYYILRHLIYVLFGQLLLKSAANSKLGALGDAKRSSLLASAEKLTNQQNFILGTFMFKI